VALKFPKSDKYNFTRNLVKRHKLVPYLDRYLGDEVKDFTFTYEAKKHDDAWHPSSHCTPSVTELYGIVTEDQGPKDWGVAMLKTFMVGHFWHQLLQKAVVDLELAAPCAIERKGVRVWKDIKPADVEKWDHPHAEARNYYAMDCYRKEDLYWYNYPEQKDGRITDEMIAKWPDDELVMGKIRPAPYHWATGAGDVAPLVLPTHGEYAVDFKTMSANQFKPFESTGQLPDWAKDKYEAQINIYMDFFDLEKALIVGVCKDSPHTFAEAEFHRNQPLIDAIYDKWEFVSECIDHEWVPTIIDDEEFDLTPFFKGPVAQ
jgi:hypothetical protein